MWAVIINAKVQKRGTRDLPRLPAPAPFSGVDECTSQGYPPSIPIPDPTTTHTRFFSDHPLRFPAVNPFPGAPAVSGFHTTAARHAGPDHRPRPQPFLPIRTAKPSFRSAWRASRVGKRWSRGVTAWYSAQGRLGRQERLTARPPGGAHEHSPSIPRGGGSGCSNRKRPLHCLQFPWLLRGSGPMAAELHTLSPPPRE